MNVKGIYPAYGPQLRKILVGLILFDSMMFGTEVISGATQGSNPGVSLLVLVEDDEMWRLK